MFGSVLLERAPVATITLNRPDRRNAWTLTLAGELSEALAICDDDDEVRVVVVTGAGRDFSVGADLSDGDILRPGGDDGVRREGVMPPQMRKPVVAAVNGNAVGAGVTFPLLCDIRVVAEDAKLGLPFVRRGVITEMTGTWNLILVAGFAVAADLLLTGRVISGREAVDLGICSRACPSEEVLPTALAIASEIATFTSPAAVAAAKELLWSSASSSRPESARREAELFRWLAAQPDAVEGVRSFLEKRPPQWSSRPGVRLPPAER